MNSYHLEMSRYYADLERRLKALFLRIPLRDAPYNELLGVGEYGLALEFWCETVSSEGKVLPEDVWLEVRSLAEVMGLPPENWKYLEPSDKLDGS